MMASNTLVRGAWMVIVRWIVIGPVRSGVDCGWLVWVLVGMGLGGSFTTTFERGDRGGTWKGARFICRVLLASWKRAGINSELPIVVWKAA